MRYRNLFFIMMIGLPFSLLSQKIKSIEQLKFQIDTLLQQQKGKFAVAFKNLSNNETVFINEHEIFHAASTMKTPVLVEVYKQAKAGKFSLDDSIVIKNEFKSIVDSSTYSLTPDDDSEFDLYKKVGQKTTD